MNRVVVGLSGASGTGKTTLANKLTQWFGGTVAAWNGMSAARDAANELFGQPLPYLAQNDEQRDALFLAILDRIDKAVSEHKEGLLVLDRTPLDQLAYGTMHHTPAIFKDDVYEKTMSIANKFNLIGVTYVRRFIKVGDDPARKEQIRYHKMFEEILAMYARCCLTRVDDITGTSGYYEFFASVEKKLLGDK